MELRLSRLFGWGIAWGLVLGLPTWADEPKNHDLDVIREESKVPPYRLPPVLVSADGRPVTDPQDWFQNRRPQLIALFGNLLYGVVPSPEVPVRTTTELLKTDRRFLGGQATRKDVRLRFHNAKGEVDLRILVITPNGSGKPSPVFLLHSFSGTRDDGHDPHPDRPGFLRNGVPIQELLQRGFGLVVVPQSDLVRHNEVEFLKGIHPLFYRAGQSFPQSYEWGVISAVAWGGSRAMDYLEKDPDVDARRVAILGHSKLGKAALWTAAQDTRFALVVSAQSGCAGAALWKRDFGENMEKMVTRFPYWLCRNAARFARNEADLPIDQHELLACIAPRPLYVASGAEDLWADPVGEYLSAHHASEVYRLLGKKGLDSPTPPPVGTALTEGDVAYHNRPGGHSVELYDWRQFLAFAERHFRR
jgi:hypothetical protein